MPKRKRDAAGKFTVKTDELSGDSDTESDKTTIQDQDGPGPSRIRVRTPLEMLREMSGPPSDEQIAVGLAPPPAAEAGPVLIRTSEAVGSSPARVKFEASDLLCLPRSTQFRTDNAGPGIQLSQGLVLIRLIQPHCWRDRMGCVRGHMRKLRAHLRTHNHQRTHQIYETEWHWTDEQDINPLGGFTTRRFQIAGQRGPRTWPDIYIALETA